MSFDDFIKGVDNLNKALDLNNNPLSEGSTSQFKTDGFSVPATFAADGNGLPFNKVPSHRPSQFKRNIITWFVPEFGIVRMFVNPERIVYTHKKRINSDRTKGGFTLQYWGEELTNISLGGTTGSSGIEGINMLYEIYRAEQYSFDAVGLTLAANNASTGLANNIVGGINDAVTGTNGVGSLIAGSLEGILGLDSPNNNLSAKTIPSLAQQAFSVEMFYNGWVYRGYFDTMVVTERADNFLLDYQITFIATQRRGYRTNYFPWSKSTRDGASSYGTPNSFSGTVT